MAACSDTEEKPSSPKETLPLKIRLENAVNHEMRKTWNNELSDLSKNYETFPEIAEKSNPKDVSTLSEDEFLELMIEASTFNKSSNQESDLLKKLRKDNPVTDTEPSDKVKLIRNYTSQFSLHRNSRNYFGTTPAFAGSSSQLRTSDGRKKHSRNKDESSSKNTLNANVLQKGIHQSQSLQDLMSSDLSKSKQKSHKAHRTHSLSSDEVLGIDSDPIASLKSSKKSGKASSSSSSTKLEVSNKTSSSKSSSKAPINLGSVSITLDMDDEGGPCSAEDCLADQSAKSANSRKEQSSEKGASSNSPIEIEMEEIKSDKASSKDDYSLASTNLEKSENRLAESNSKFYVDCNDIDTTVTFPLKLVSSIEEQNSDDAINEQLKRFPLVPWPRPLQVQSFFSSLSMDGDAYNARNEKQLLGSDINGNPFTRNTRPSNLASLVSSTLLDYSSGNLASESKNRKNKRLRNSVNKGVLSENIAGHRGEEDIDTLLQYINSSDKKCKSTVKSNNVIGSKTSFYNETEKKKNFSKELKSCNKNIIQTDKKKLSRSNSLENITSAKRTDLAEIFGFETRMASMGSSLKDSHSVDFENSAHKNLDINSNEENRFETNEKSKDSSTDESSLHNSIGRSSPEVSSFAADFYSTADVSSQTVEDSGFLVVKKKQRKKYQSKRTDSLRWRNAQVQRKKGIMLPLAESKCGKQDSRRKSTSSVPHSEHSSADNSDLDSVHSLPVRGSVPHPTQPHPHTTPSSSSSTPQASYADIARMPISKLNSPSPCIITYSAQTSVSQVTGEQETKKTDKFASSVSAMGKRRASDSTSSNKDMPRATAVDNDRDRSVADVKVRSHAKSTREINTQTEPESTAVVDPLKVEPSSGKSMKKIDDSSKVACSVCNALQKNACSCPKSLVCTRQKAKCLDLPPVIMDNMPSELNTCNVSFGFGIEEVLEMAPANNTTLSSDLRQTDNLENSTTSEEMDLKDEEKQGKCEGIFEISSVNKRGSTSAESSSESSSSDVVSKTVHNQDLSPKPSSHLKTVCYGTGRNICYSETKVNMKKFNLSEMANFLGTEFQSIEKEIEGNRSKASSKGMYYVDSSEEA